MANSHRRGNHITKMKINEVWVKEDDEMKQGIVEAFKSLVEYKGVESKLRRAEFPK